MKKRTVRSYATFAGCLLLLSLFTSCASLKDPIAVDHQSYSPTPLLPSSRIYRGLAKSIPGVSKAAFHGNWGGSGNRGGAPVDEIDEAFRRHDIVYYESRCGKHLKAADRALVNWLEQVDEDSLSPEARRYRERAIKFMQSPMANVVGKPLVVMLKREEREDCYFQSPEVVERFFAFDHPGFPWVEPESSQAAPREAEPALVASASL